MLKQDPIYAKARSDTAKARSDIAKARSDIAKAVNFTNYLASD